MNYVNLENVLYLNSWFWKWEDDGTTIAWSDGRTLAFAAEIMSLIKTLGNDKVPPLGGLLLFLACLRDNWSEPPTRGDILREFLKKYNRRHELTLLDEVLLQLDRLHKLPSSMRSDISCKAEVIGEIFSELVNYQHGYYTRQLLQKVLSTGDLKVLLPVPDLKTGLVSLMNDLRCLHMGLRGVNDEYIKRLLLTGIVSNVIEAKIPPPPVLTPRQVMSQLLSDQELGGLARLTKRMLSLVTIPKPLDEPDDLPVGGVTDIAPRGTYDRLLLSELAYDDETLAVRLAHNEAMFYRRETPPTHLPVRRIIVFDVGIRMWGLPRLYGLAVGLAMTIQREPHVEFKLHYYAQGDIHTAEVQVKEGWEKLQGALDTLPHPATSLELITDMYESDEIQAELILITCREARRDPAFVQRLNRLPLSEYLVALVSREGDYELWKHTTCGMKCLQQAKIDLQEILDTKNTEVLKIESRDHSVLPAFFYKPFPPLRTSSTANHHDFWHIDSQQLVSVTKDNILLLWDNPKYGGIELLRNLPTGRILAVDYDHELQQLKLIIGTLSAKSMHVVVCQMDGILLQTYALNNQLETPREVLFHKEFIYLFSDHKVEVATIGSTGKSVVKDLPSHKYRNGRFISIRMTPSFEWKCIFFDGQQIVFHDLHWDKPDSNLKLKHHSYLVFEYGDARKLMVLQSNGQLVNLETGEVKNTALDTHSELTRPWIIETTKDREHLIIRSSNKSQEVLLQVQSGLILGKGVKASNKSYQRAFSQKRLSIYRQFHDLCLDTQNGSNRLGLITNMNYVHRLNENMLLSTDLTKMSSSDKAYKWKPIHHELISGFTVGYVEFLDGSRIYKDSRGYLHFRSSDPALPEFSIVLCCDHMAGWSSDGRTWGVDYFHGAAANTNVVTARQNIIDPFMKRLS